MSTSFIVKVLMLLLCPLYWFIYFIPRNKKIWIFSAASGKGFVDNSKYLFIAQHQEKVINNKYIWISRSKYVVQLVRSLGYDAEYVYSLKGIYYQLRAGTFLFTHRTIDYAPILSSGARITALWHGVPIKKIGLDGDYAGKTESLSVRLKVIFYKIFPYTYYMTCDYVVNPVPAFDGYYRTAFKISAPKIIHSQQPRVVNLLENNFNHPSFAVEMEFIKLILSKDTKLRVWVWMPTHRMHRKDFDINKFLSDYDFDFRKLNQCLLENDILLVIKLHPMEQASLGVIVDEMTNIVCYPFEDPYPLIACADVLVTDYSSIAIDYSVLNRPIVFFTLDDNQYKKEVGLYYDLSSLFINGYFAETFVEFLSTISMVGNLTPTSFIPKFAICDYDACMGLDK